MGVSAVDHLNSSGQPQPGETPWPVIWTTPPVSHGVGAEAALPLDGGGVGQVKPAVQNSCHESTSFA